MPRAMKGAGKGAATKRKERRHAKFNPGPGPQSVKPVGGAEDAGFDDGNVEAKKRKKLGKLSKKRKAKGASNDDADDAPAAAAKKKSKKSAVDAAHKAVSKRHDSKPAWTNQTRREQKDWANEQKALQKPNFTLIQEITALWERLRVKKISKDDKRKLVAAIFKASKGKCAILANNHKASRVIQALLKYGTEDERASVYAECAPHLGALAKSLYGHFIVQKLVDATPKEKLPELLANVKGRVRVLAKHPVGSQVLEALYWPAPAPCKRDMECEFYGSEFAMFGASGLSGDADKPATSLREAMLSKPVAQRQGMLREMNKTLLPILEKGLVSPSLIHKVLSEYLLAGGPGTRYEAAHSVAGPAMLRMIHTRDGAHAVNMMMSHAGARQRKMVLKALKGNVARVVRDDHGSMAIACLLDCVDDTAQLGKVIINELKAEGLVELAEDPAARRVLLHLLRPRARRYVHPHALATLPDQDEVARSVKDAKEALTAQGHAVGGDDDEDDEAGDDDDGDAVEDADVEGADVDEDDEMDDEMMDDEFDDDEFDEGDAAGDEKVNGMTKFKSKTAEAAAAVDESDDEGAGKEGGASDSVDFGIARKPSDVRRREIFGHQGKLGAALVDACERNASSMLRSVAGCDVLVETCSGGAGGALTRAVGAERLRKLHVAVAEAVRASVEGEEDKSADDDDDGEGEGEGEGKAREPLHTGFVSSRALRRMVLDIPGPQPGADDDDDSTGAGAGGDAGAPSFAAALWRGAVAGTLAKWVHGHGAKVVAAIVRAGDEATVTGATAALGKILKGENSVDEWVAGFFRDGANAKAGAKAKAGGAKASTKKPAADGKKNGESGASGKKADAAAAPKTPAKTPATSTPAGKKASSKKAGAKEEAPAEAEGSMKKKKFSPRQTRAQRAAKAAGK